MPCVHVADRIGKTNRLTREGEDEDGEHSQGASVESEQGHVTPALVIIVMSGTSIQSNIRERIEKHKTHEEQHEDYGQTGGVLQSVQIVEAAQGGHNGEAQDNPRLSHCPEAANSEVLHHIGHESSDYD